MAAPKKAVGPKSDKIWREAIMLAVKRDAEVADGGGKHLDRLARKLIEKACEGDVGALKEIGDRLDGKAAQSIGLGQAPDLEPIEATVRPQISRAAWLALHSK